jgi:putative transposase
MMLNGSEEFPVRRHPVHGIKYVEGQPTIIFETFCVKNRFAILANEVFHSAFQKVASESTAWIVGRYVIMPDHIHFFAADVGNEIQCENWIKYLKSQLTRQMAPQAGGRGSRRAAAGVSSPPDSSHSHTCNSSRFRWQTDHWDTRMRNPEVYEEKWQYVLNNPVRQGLVARAEDWPYQGEIHQLRW